MPRRKSASAPTPEAISAKVAAKVSGSTSWGPPVPGSVLALGVAVGLALAVALAVEVAVALAVAVAIAVWWVARAPGANSKTITADVVNSNNTFFTKHPFHRVGALKCSQHSHPPFPCEVLCKDLRFELTSPNPDSAFP
jgi:hypothetical protein